MMTTALAVPGERGWLASALARFLPDAVEVCPAHAEVLRRTLESELMASWPAMYLKHYVTNIVTIARADPRLAQDVLLTIWRFQEDRQDVTSMTQGVVSLNSTRKQDIEHIKWLIGEKFRNFIIEGGLRRAVPVLAEATTQDPGPPSMVPSYPVSAGSAVGQVDLWSSPFRCGTAHHSALTISTSFAEVMQTTEITADEADDLVVDLVATVRHPEAWRDLLRAAAEKPAVLGRAFVPALQTGGLLAHPETRSAACMLLRSVVSHLSDTELDDLETAILRAPSLPDNATDERRGAIMDQLVRCLDASRVRHPDLARRLAHLVADGVTPEIIDDDDDLGKLSAEPITLRDYLGNPYDDLTQEERDTLDSLRQAIDPAEKDDADSDALDMLETALHRAVDGTAALFVRVPLHQARELLIRATEVLIKHRAPLPSTPLGELIISLLLDATTLITTDEADEQR